MGESENDRQYRVLDQMLTAHAALRDRYRSRAFWLNVSLLGFAVVLNAFVFAGDGLLVALFGVGPERVKIGLGITSVVLMVLSIVELRVDWPGKGQSHAEAAALLAQLKAKFRKSYAEQSSSPSNSEDVTKALADDYSRAMSELPPIPDSDFAKLKARHLTKRMLSQEVSEHPGVPLVLLSLRLRWRAIRKMLGKGKGQITDAMGSERER